MEFRYLAEGQKTFLMNIFLSFLSVSLFCLFGVMIISSLKELPKKFPVNLIFLSSLGISSIAFGCLILLSMLNVYDETMTLSFFKNVEYVSYAVFAMFILVIGCCIWKSLAARTRV